MTDADHTPSVGLEGLDGLSYDGVKTWLGDALHGRTALPLAVPDESPEQAILRCESSLSSVTRRDLHRACEQLVRDYCKDTKGKDDGYVAALLRLAKGLMLDNIKPLLLDLARDKRVFTGLPPGQQKSVLFTLVDMRAPTGATFWQEVVQSNPRGLGVIAISALLHSNSRGATEILPSLPDDELTADSLYVVFDQHARGRDADKVRELIAEVQAHLGQCTPLIQAALQEWMDEVAAAPAPASTSGRLIAVALKQRAERHGLDYRLNPMSARLTGQQKAA